MGINSDPVTLHKYLYAHASPTNGTDPSGYFFAAAFAPSTAIQMSQISAAVNLIGMSVILSNLDSLANLESKPERAASSLSLGLAKFKVRQCQRSGMTDCNAGIPVMVHGSGLGELTKHIYDAQFGGKTPVLSKRSSEHSRTWLQGRRECEGNSPTRHGDEYPFAITDQGGEDNFKMGMVSLRVINGRNNCSGGACLRHFFRECDVTASDPFKKWFGVIADPGLPIRNKNICSRD